MRHRVLVVLLFEQRKLLRRQYAAHLIAQFMHRGRVERASGGMRLRESADQRLDSLLLIGRETERRKSSHVAVVEHLR